MDSIFFFGKWEITKTSEGYYKSLAERFQKQGNSKLMPITTTALKVSKYGVISGPNFPAFGLNTERYEVSLRI